MEIQIAVHGREAGKKSVLRKLRKEGKLPAVIYGAKYKPRPVWVDGKEMSKLLGSSETSVVKLKDGEKDITAIIKEVAYDTLTDRPSHIDFQKIEAKKEIELKVHVELEGECPGVKAGGVLDFITREVAIKTIPSKIPGSLKLDISAVEMGDVLKVSDLKVPEGVTVHTPADTICVSVKAPRKEEAPVEEEAVEGAEGAAEPEVAKKGKEDQGEEETEKTPEKAAEAGKTSKKSKEK